MTLKADVQSHRYGSISDPTVRDCEPLTPSRVRQKIVLVRSDLSAAMQISAYSGQIKKKFGVTSDNIGSVLQA
jgi:hypothetical protein